MPTTSRSARAGRCSAGSRLAFSATAYCKGLITASGVAVQSGHDDNKDGTLQAIEVDATSYVCQPATATPQLVQSSSITVSAGLTSPVN